MPIMDTNDGSLSRSPCRASTCRQPTASGLAGGGCPAWRPRAPRQRSPVTTVYDIMLAHYAVEREGLPGQCGPPTGSGTSTPGTRVAGGSHVGLAAAAIKIGREFAQNAVETQGPFHDPHGRWHELTTAPTRCTDIPGTHGNGTQGRNVVHWAHYVGQRRSARSWPGFLHLRLLTGRPPRQMISTGWYHYDHRPVALRRCPASAMANSDQVPSHLDGALVDTPVESVQRADALLPDVLQGFDPAGSRGR